MPGPAIQLKTPEWLDPTRASVFDSPLQKALRTIGGLLGGNDPTSQVLGLMTTELPTGEVGPLGKAIGRLKDRVIKAYHGSPHDFEAFSMSKIGTGEGAQAYGHGLYFAENEGVAKAYREQLSHGEALTVRLPGVKPLRGEAIDDIGLDAAKFLEIGEKDAGQFPHNRAYYAQKAADRAAAGLPGAQARNEAVKARIQQWADAKIGYEPIEGKTYEVAIKADPEDFLDWDKPLSQQSEKVKAALRKQGLTGKRWEVSAVGQSNVPDDPRMDLSGGHFYNDRYVFDSPIEARAFIKKLRGEGVDAKPIMSSAWKGELEGREAYQVLGESEVTNPMLSHLTGGPQKAAAKLREAGIPGIKYLDQGSRGGRAPYSGDSAYLHAATSVKSGGYTPEGALEVLRKSYANADEHTLRAAVDEAFDVAPKQTSNYVVFDDKLVDILRKYGLLAPAGAEVLNESREQQ